MDGPMRFALIGAGMVSDASARSLMELENAELVVVFSRTEERAKSFAEKYGVPWATDMESILARDDVDAVVITTAPHNHKDHAIAAMQAGKHALVEKPMGISVAECDEVMAAAEDTGKTLGFIFQNRFKKSLRRVTEFVDSGRLGQLLHLSGYVKWYRPQAYYDSAEWRGHFWGEGGGATFTQAGHTLDQMRWIGGPVEWLFTNMVTTPVHQGIEVEDLATVTLRFANGATGTLEASTALYPGSGERLEVHGTRGTIGIEAGNIVKWDILDATPEDEPGDTYEESGTGASDPMAFPITWHKALIADFIEAVRENRPPFVNADEARQLNELMDAIYESGREMRVVRVKGGA